jgi:hypothetical protein
LTAFDKVGIKRLTDKVVTAASDTHERGLLSAERRKEARFRRLAAESEAASRDSSI